MVFELVSDYKPTGDQPQAIEKLVEGLSEGRKHQVLLGVTGSGKTFTMANVIARLNRPTLVISHNKTLAAQLTQEYKEFFPQNAVEYFVSYYDYYQPEAYIPARDQYIEKEADINQEIERLRLSTTASLLTRQDVIVVASVSCIYNLGSPVEYGKSVLTLSAVFPRHPEIFGAKDLNSKDSSGRVPQNDDSKDLIGREAVMKRLIDLFYDRSDFDFRRSTFRVRGNVIDVWPAYDLNALRLEFDDNDIIKYITRISPLTGARIPDPGSDGLRSGILANPVSSVLIYPAKHYVSDRRTYEKVFGQIRDDLRLRINELEARGKRLEAHRLKQRTEFDLESIKTLGYCSGIENYSRYFDGRQPGEPPYTLLDYFDRSQIPHLNPSDAGSRERDWLVIIDESHITIPQIRGMYNGDRSRKETLIDYGFRLPSAADNRPLRFDEFLRKIPQTIYTSATPGDWEISMVRDQGTNLKTRTVPKFGTVLEIGTVPVTDGVVEQLVRPTGLLDPEIEIRKTEGQIDNLIREIEKRVGKKERTLVTTITKRLAEELSTYIVERGRSLLKGPSSVNSIKVTYLHSDVETLERTDVLDDLRRGNYDVVVGINLLREGLDLPEVSLVAILDADKEGFLRSEISLIQTMGRAARHVHGKVILYADQVTGSMARAIKEVERRREIQEEYNRQHQIVPRSIQKPFRARLIQKEPEEDSFERSLLSKEEFLQLSPPQQKNRLKDLELKMREAAEFLDFERAAGFRDGIRELKKYT